MTGIMRILITGAGGFLGQGLVHVLAEAGHSLRLLDVRPFKSPHEVVIGSVTDLACARLAMKDMDGLLIAHMAPRSPDAYVEPPVCFDINVKGTANLFFAAREAGVRRVVLISSMGAVSGYPKEEFHPHDLAPRADNGLYAVTKVHQEIIAEQYSREHGMAVAALRMGHVIDIRQKTDKYGKHVEARNVRHADRFDIGEAALRCMELPGLRYETFYVSSVPDGEDSAAWDLAHTFKRLNWWPRHGGRNV